MSLLRRAGRVAVWLVVVYWLVLIFDSPDRGGAGFRGPPFPFLLLFPPWTWQWILHGVAFGILTALTYVAVRLSVPWRWPLVSLVALLVAVASGAVDEVRQSFVASRSSEVADVGRDALGAVVVILLIRAVAVAMLHLLHGGWVAFGRISSITLVLLEGAAVVWIAALWMTAGSEASYSLTALRGSDFQQAILRQPLALLVGAPYLAIAVWSGLRWPGSILRQGVLVMTPAAATALLLGVPLASYGLDLVPDRGYVWLGTWAAAVVAWVWGASLLAVMRWR